MNLNLTPEQTAEYKRLVERLNAGTISETDHIRLLMLEGLDEVAARERLDIEAGRSDGDVIEE